MDTDSRITASIVLGLTLLIGISAGLFLGCLTHEHSTHDAKIMFVAR